MRANSPSNPDQGDGVIFTGCQRPSEDRNPLSDALGSVSPAFLLSSLGIRSSFEFQPFSLMLFSGMAMIPDPTQAVWLKVFVSYSRLGPFRVDREPIEPRTFYTPEGDGLNLRTA